MSALRQRKPIIDVEETTTKPFFRKVSAIDMFPKPKEDYRRTQTYYGAVVSILTVALIGSLVAWEVGAYIIGRDAYRTELGVDETVSSDMILNLDISFPNVPCHELSLAVLDVTGTVKLNVTRSVHKTPLTASGESAFFHHDLGSASASRDLDDHADGRKDPNSPNFCGHCFSGPPGSGPGERLALKYKNVCCNTCDDVLKAYDEAQIPRPNKNEIQQCWYEVSLVNPGCKYYGSLRVRKVSGSILFSPKMTGTGFLVRDVLRFVSSHTISKLSIGDERVARFSRRGVHYPLNGHHFNANGAVEVKYFLKVVPTAYFDGRQDTATTSAFEYGVQWHHRRLALGFGGGLPSVAFHYEFSPLKVINHFRRPPFYHFLVQLCGIVGGLFVVLGLIDGLVVRVSRLMGCM